MADAIKDILLKINLDTKSVDAGIKALDGKFESLGGNVKTDTFKTLKQQIRDATNEAQNLGQQFGLNSQQFATAAKKVAELKDQFGDANKVIEKFNPDNKLQGLIGIASGAATAVQGIAGAFTLIGVNADTAQVAIAKLQGVMALTSAISSIDDIKNSFIGLQNVAKNFLNSLSKGELIGIAIAGVAALGVVLYSVFNTTTELTEAQKQLNREREISNSLNVEANKSAGQEIANLDLLYSRATNVNLSLKERKIATNELQKQYPEHFKNVSDDIILQGKAKTAYDRTKDSILAYAKAMAAQSKLTELAVKELDLELNKSELEFKKKQADDAIKLQALAATSETGPKGAAATYGPQTENLRLLQTQQKKIVLDLDNNNKELTRIASDQDFIRSKITVTPTKSGGGGGGGGVTTPKQPKGETNNDVINSLKNNVTGVNPESEIRVSAEQAANQRILDFKRAFNSDYAQLDDERLKNSELVGNAQFLIEDNNAKARSEIAQIEFDNKMALMDGYASIATGLAQLAGDQTIAGKALAVAAASIDTYAAITKTLRAFGDKPIPGYAIAQAVATGVFGLVQVKKILATKVPGKGGGSGAGSAPTPSASSIIPPSLNTTSLTQQVQDVRVTNQSGQSVVRAYITNEELRTNQDKQTFLNKLSSF